MDRIDLRFSLKVALDSSQDKRIASNVGPIPEDGGAEGNETGQCLLIRSPDVDLT